MSNKRIKPEWLLTLVVLILLACTYGVHYVESNKLKKEGRTAKGTVTDCDFGDRSFHVEYLFKVDGLRVTGSAQMLANHNPGDSIRIIYLPSDPHVNRPDVSDELMAH